MALKPWDTLLLQTWITGTGCHPSLCKWIAVPQYMYMSEKVLVFYITELRNVNDTPPSSVLLDLTLLPASLNFFSCRLFHDGFITK